MTSHSIILLFRCALMAGFFFNSRLNSRSVCLLHTPLSTRGCVSRANILNYFILSPYIFPYFLCYSSIVQKTTTEIKRITVATMLLENMPESRRKVVYRSNKNAQLSRWNTIIIVREYYSVGCLSEHRTTTVRFHIIVYEYYVYTSRV